ncbi:MAG: hypothetical protein V2A58_01585, partial [Planctomycetota bacterium]
TNLHWWIERHDSAYNVLFGDGSVKTFSDSGKSLMKQYILRSGWNVAGQTRIPPVGMAQKVQYLWQTYFDQLYAQD